MSNRKYTEYDMKDMLIKKYGLLDSQPGSAAPHPSAAQNTYSPQQPQTSSQYLPLQQQNTGFETRCILFDTYNFIQDTPRGELKWNFSEVTTLSDPSINDCIGIEIMSFYIPKINPGARPDYFYYKRVQVEILEIPPMQGYLSLTNRFHFEFDIANLNSLALELVPLNPIYYSNKPFNLNSLTMRFYKPPSFELVPFPQTHIYAYTVPFSNPLRFIVPVSTKDIASIGTCEVAVRINDFTSNLPGLNSMLKKEDVFITRVIDETTFEINSINGEQINNSYQARVFIFKNRIAINARFIMKKPYTTNNVIFTQ